MGDVCIVGSRYGDIEQVWLTSNKSTWRNQFFDQTKGFFAMHSQRLQFSYEFFPPRTPTMTLRLWRTVGQLERLNPNFFSMTYGALGSAQQISIDAAITMHKESPVPVAAHLTAANATRDETNAIAKKFHDAGIDRIVALRGDSGAEEVSDNSYQDAIELVEGLKSVADFDISVAAYPEIHPQARSAAHDLQNLKYKLDAGANRAITQFFLMPTVS